jgi:hypothetical protein
MNNNIALKVRPYKLNITLREFNNPYGKNKIEGEIEDTMPSLNLLIDRDLYLTEKGLSELKKIFFNHYKEPITENLTTIIEGKFYNLFNTLFSSKDLYYNPVFFYGTVIEFSIDGISCAKENIARKTAELPFFKIPQTPYFEYY